MYTEENEFDYNDYDNYNDYDENVNNGQKKSFFNKSLIIKVLAIIGCLILVIFIIFSIKNRNNSLANSDNSIVVFDNNITMVKDAAQTYFFEQDNLPSDVGSVGIITVNDLIDKGLLTEIKDHNGVLCGYKTSYASLTKNQNEYVMKVYLSCESVENGVTYYYDLDGKCLTCNGENYTPSIDIDNDSNVNDENADNETNNDSSNSLVCGIWSEWTTELKTDTNLDKEERIVVIGYKENITYGDWSSWVTTPLTASSYLEVEAKDFTETKTEYTSWSKYSTIKPSSKTGRVIDTKKETESYTTYVNKEVFTTKTLTYSDPNAYSCENISLGKYECTYKTTQKVPTTKTKTVTYYRYKDEVSVETTTTFYRSRSVVYNEPSYTNYILESEMPEGYQKLSNSEITQYRYREKCSK